MSKKEKADDVSADEKIAELSALINGPILGGLSVPYQAGWAAMCDKLLDVTEYSADGYNDGRSVLDALDGLCLPPATLSVSSAEDYRDGFAVAKNAIEHTALVKQWRAAHDADAAV